MGILFVLVLAVLGYFWGSFGARAIILIVSLTAFRLVHGLIYLTNGQDPPFAGLAVSVLIDLAVFVAAFSCGVWGRRIASRADHS